MIFQGTFNNRENTKTYRVTIGKSGLNRVIVDPFDREFKRYGDKVLFDEDPVTISCERDELTQQIIIRQAEIRLMANYDLSDTLFADTNRSIPVTIEQKNGNNYVGVFRGFVDPLQFNQGAVSPYEAYTVHATDPLGALEELKVDKLVTYRMDDAPTIKALIEDIIRTIGCDVDYSKWVDSPNKPNDDLVVNMSVFFGDSEDDYMTLYEILENLLIYQGAMMYYNPAANRVYLMNLYVSNSTNVNFNLKNNAMDTSTNLSMSDVYSQIKLKCEIDPIEDEISIFDTKSLYSDYPSYQKYMTELYSLGEGRTAFNAMRDMVNSPNGEEATNYESGYRIEHFCWIKKSKQWDFGPNGYDKLTPYIDQSGYLNVYLKNHRGHGMFVSFGKSNRQDKKDNSPLQNVNMTDYLMIYVDGHYDSDPEGDIKTFTNLYGQGPNKIPYICKYTGLQSVSLTPPDRSVTNYIVINGKILLNAIQGRTGLTRANDNQNLYEVSLNTYNATKPHFANDWDLWHHTIPITKDDEWAGGGSYYLQKFWQCADPLNPNYSLKYITGKNPPIGNMEIEWNKKMKYIESIFGEQNADIIKKLPILACELKVGDKYCCERIDKGVKGQNVFEWHTEEYLNSHPDIPRYITIGIDPKIDDYIIGQTFDISNTVEYNMNIDEKGMAIPIKIDDKLNGVPEFKILNPVNIMLNNNFYVRLNTLLRLLFGNIQPQQYVLEQIESILISDLSINFVSDHGKVREGYTTADNDLVYCSDEMPMYIQDNENSIKICTPLTMNECLTYGIKYQISNSYIYHSNDDPFYGWIYDSTRKVKPEQMWVDYMYRQCCKPRKILSTCVKDTLFFNTASVNKDIGNWMTNGTINGTIGTSKSNFSKGFITKMSWDVKNRSVDIDIREAQNYTPIWE